MTFYSSAPLERYACAHGWQFGGGLYIKGTATLTDTNVYSNAAESVCSPFNLSLNPSSAPMETDVVLVAGRVVVSTSTPEPKQR